MNSVYFVTLGCSKNDVDSKNMSSILNKEKYFLAEGLESANIIIVNTCGFIEAAKAESIDTIIAMTDYKVSGQCKKLLLAGCLAQRYADDLLKEIPEVDGIIGTGNIKDINTVLDSAMEDLKPVIINNLNSEYIEGLSRLGNSYSEYIKISEGCNNNCSYCIIPKLRGRNRSRKIEDIYSEVVELVEKGTREVILIAQNTTDYGIDIYGKYDLSKLIIKLSEIEKLKWIRVLYLYPDHFTDELIEQFRDNEKLVKYVDIPLQHISDGVLKNMNRNTSSSKIRFLINKLRESVPEIIIRTTFIVGFPGEKDSDFRELLSFVKEISFDKLGVFTYSLEEDTPAYTLDEQVKESVKEARRDEIMDLQQDISQEKMAKHLGKILEVLIEDYAGENIYEGRSYMDSPEIDGIVYVNSDRELAVGEFVNVRITDSMEYDLVGDIV